MTAEERFELDQCHAEIVASLRHGAGDIQLPGFCSAQDVSDIAAAFQRKIDELGDRLADLEVLQKRRNALRIAQWRAARFLGATVAASCEYDVARNPVTLVEIEQEGAANARR